MNAPVDFSVTTAPMFPNKHRIIRVCARNQLPQTDPFDRMPIVHNGDMRLQGERPIPLSSLLFVECRRTGSALTTRREALVHLHLHHKDLILLGVHTCLALQRHAEAELLGFLVHDDETRPQRVLFYGVLGNEPNYLLLNAWSTPPERELHWDCTPLAQALGAREGFIAVHADSA